MSIEDQANERRSAVGRVVQTRTVDDGPDIVTQVLSSTDELSRRAAFVEQFRNSPVPDNEVLSNIGLFLNRQTLSRLLFLNEMYQAALDVHGVVMEFGVRWGRDLVAFS